MLSPKLSGREYVPFNSPTHTPVPPPQKRDNTPYSVWHIKMAGLSIHSKPPREKAKEHQHEPLFGLTNPSSTAIEMNANALSVTRDINSYTLHSIVLH